MYEIHWQRVIAFQVIGGESDLHLLSLGGEVGAKLLKSGCLVAAAAAAANSGTNCLLALANHADDLIRIHNVRE